VRLRFTIRDLLWLTALVAMALGWWLNRASLIADLSASQREMQIERVESDHYIDSLRQHGAGVDGKAQIEAIQRLWDDKK
jgi:hypothetical protein